MCEVYGNLSLGNIVSNVVRKVSSRVCFTLDETLRTTLLSKFSIVFRIYLAIINY